MSETIRLCKKGELAENQCREIEFEIAGELIPAFVLFRDGLLHCYINSCPHTGATLNWNPVRFLDVTQELIQCSLHGALFKIDTGECMFGPCVGQRLRKIPTLLQDSAWFAVLD